MGAAAAQIALGSQTSQALPDEIAGRVVSGTSGAPIARVLVQLGRRAVLTDAEGRFAFAQPEDPVNAIRATKPGFFSGPEQNEMASASVPSGTDPEAVVVTLWPEALLTGTVVAPDGEPLPHISVQARRSTFDEQGHRMQVAGQAQTDSHGAFRIPVPSGDYVVESQYAPRAFESDEAVMPAADPPPTSGAAMQSVHVGPGEEQRMDLHPQVSRTYVVTLPLDAGEEGQPPRVTVRSSAGLRFSANSFRSQSPGTVRLNLPPGSYSLQATRFSRDGMQFGDSSVTVANHDLTGPPLHLGPLPSIPLDTVVDASVSSSAGTAAGSATSRATTPPNVMQFNLVLEPVDTDSGSPFPFGIRPTQQRDGVISLAAPPGTYRLNGGTTSGWYIKGASSRGADLTRYPLVVSASSTPSPITLVLSNQTGSVEGTVKLAGTPAACWVYLVPSAPSITDVVIRRSESSGSFRMTDLAPGTYRAVAFPFRHSANLEDPAVLARYATYVGSVSIAAGATAELTLEAVPAREMER